MKIKKAILSKAEFYDRPVERKSFGGPKKMPYDSDTARARFTPRLKETISRINELPKQIFPNNKVVTKFTLHPSFIAKSSYPDEFFKKYNLKSLGSKEVFIEPESRVTKEQQKTDLISSSLLFVSGRKNDFERLLHDIETNDLDEAVLEDIVKFEDFTLLEGEDKFSPIILTDCEEASLQYEVVLHASIDDFDIIESFFNYIDSIGGFVFKDKTRAINGLTFCFVEIRSDLVKTLADYAFIRVVRPIPKIKLFERFSSGDLSYLSAPKGLSDRDYRQGTNIAVFDAGLQLDAFGDPNVRYFDLTGQHADLSSNLSHGTLVTSAIVYGEADKFLYDNPVTLPVDHYKVYSAADEVDILMVDVLDRIRSILSMRAYKFVNISLGPEIPCSDDEPNLWTATLDEIASKGETLFVIAAGNKGGLEVDDCFRRIQPPADMINGMSIGAANSKSSLWSRAHYSCIGPGRRPGYVKPDALFFGGNAALGEEKVKLFNLQDFSIEEEYGTSFSAPLVLRNAALLDKATGGELSVSAIRALLIHSAKRGDNDSRECGWGLISDDISDILFCDENRVTLIYQGVLKTLSGVRAVIPWPEDTSNMTGFFKMKGTLCFYADVDQQHTISYTRAGIEVTFRPHSEKHDINKTTGKKSSHPKSKEFFTKSKVLGSEQSLRAESHKWETCTSAHTDRMNVQSMKNPVIDLKYHTRDEGQSIGYYEKKNLKPLHYSLVVTIDLEKDYTLYSEIVEQFQHLTPLNVELDTMVTVRGSDL